jgi:hypothetical protein
MNLKMLLIFLVGFFLVDQSYSYKHLDEKNVQILSRKSRHIWWNHHQTRPFMKILIEMEDRLEKLKEKEQARRNKIYSEKLASQIKSPVLRDFWAGRY